MQVILKPDPGNPQELYLGSLEALGIDTRAHDVRPRQCEILRSAQLDRLRAVCVPTVIARYTCGMQSWLGPPLLMCRLLLQTLS